MSQNLCRILLPKPQHVWSQIYRKHKKVLLHQCKRHSVPVGGTPSHPGTWPGSGVPPSQVWMWGYPILLMGVPYPADRGVPPEMGYPPSRPGKGTPSHLDLGREYPSTWTWEGSLPLPLHGPGKGLPPAWTWEGGTPQMWTDRHLWKQYLPSSFGCGW